MRLPLILLAACVAEVISTPTNASLGKGNQPDPSRVMVTALPAQGTQFKVVLTYQLPGGPDSVLTRIASGVINQAHRLRATVVRDSFLLTRPAINTTISGQGCVQSKRRGLLSGEVCRAWSYTEADQPPPPPILDSVRTDTLVMAGILRPDPADKIAGDTWNFCMLYRLGDGAVGYVGPRTPECDMFRANLGTPVTAEQQVVLDRVACTTWTVVPIQANGTTLAVTPTAPCSGVAIASAGTTSGYFLRPVPGWLVVPVNVMAE